MPDTGRKCFVMMPFVPELHYFYLYLKQHIEQHHGLRCERADDQVLTKPLLDKINAFIREADVIIADCSGRNPNVFYELGIAHALGKKVILITRDSVKEAPSDIRHYEFIQYELDKHVEFLVKLDNALSQVLAEERYEGLYELAKLVFNEFKQTTGAQIDLASKELFLNRVRDVERTEQLGQLPSMDDTFGVAKFVLPLIIANNTDVGIMPQVWTWLSEKRKTS